MLSRREILKILPHGPKALKINKITKLVPGKEAIGEVVFSSFPDHFPPPKEEIAEADLLMKVGFQVGHMIFCSLPDYQKTVTPLGHRTDESKFQRPLFRGEKLIVRAWVINRRKVVSKNKNGPEGTLWHIGTEGWVGNRSRELVFKSGFSILVPKSNSF